MILAAIATLLACPGRSVESLVIVCPPSPEPERAARAPALAGTTPSVLVVIVDDWGWPERSALPSLDALAAQGTTFERFYAWPVCSPTRLALLAGRYPRRESIGSLLLDAHNPASDRLPLSLVTMPEVFAPTHAAALFGKWHLGRAPLNNGADLGLSSADLGRAQIGVSWHAHGFEHGRAVNPSVVHAGAGASSYYNWWRYDAGLGTMETVYATDVQRDEFLSWWGTSGRKMAWLSWSAPHDAGPNEYDAPPGHSLTGSVRGDYLQILAYLDGAMAQTLAAVDLQTTYVVVIGDNGTPDDARPSAYPSGQLKGSCFEAGVRVPMIVAGPGVPAGATSQRLVSALDIGKTLAEVSGLGAPAGHDDAVSFADALGPHAGAKPRAFVFVERYEVTGSATTIPQPAGYDEQAVIEVAWKLRRWDADGNGPGASVDAAYHLPSDPFEQTPIDPLLLPAGLRTRLYAELASIPPRAP